MINASVVWLCAHPLEFVGILVAVGVLIGVMFIPRVHEITDHGHPRC